MRRLLLRQERPVRAAARPGVRDVPPRHARGPAPAEPDALRLPPGAAAPGSLAVPGRAAAGGAARLTNARIWVSPAAHRERPGRSGDLWRPRWSLALIVVRRYI